MSVFRCDLHMHTNFSFDSQVTMEQYAQMAVERNIDVICFTDHIELAPHRNTFDQFAFAKRREHFERVKQQFAGKVTLTLGFEIGSPHMHPKELAFLRSLQPDLIIGSVHYPMQYEGIAHNVGRRAYEDYYNKHVLAMVLHGGFDVLGHPDMPKRYHDDFVPNVDHMQKVMQLCAQKGIVPEINTASLRYGCNQPMPDLDTIDYYVTCGGKYVCINSDSHVVGDLGSHFFEVQSQLPQGAQLCYFCKGKPVPVDKK